MEKIQNNLAEEVLAHHGILGMHWGIRRYQPYPSDYSGDGKFMGKRHERKLAKIEKKKARHKAKVETIINNAIRDGDKKALNKIKSEIEESEYNDKYKQLVENGLANAVKDRSKENLKNFKEDLSPRDYKHQQDRIDFKKAIDDDDSKKAKKLLPKVDPDDVKEATELIKSRVALQDQKLSKIRQDSEFMAKLDKVNSGLTKVSNITKTVSNISSNIQSVNDTITKFSKAASDAEETRKKKEIEKVVKSGNLDKIEEYKTRMSYDQLKEAYNKAYAMDQKNIDRAISTGNVDEIYEAMPFMDSEQMMKAINKVKEIQKLGGTYHSDASDEEVISHHGVPGMKWGVRRFQPYPKGYTGDGRYVGSNASKNLAEDLNSLIKKGATFEDNYRKSLLGSVYKRNENAIKRNAYRRNAVKSNTKQKIGEYVLTNEKTNKTFKKYEKVIKEYANARDEEDKRPKVEDKIFNDVKKYNELQAKAAEDYIKKNNCSPSEADDVRNDIEGIIGYSDVIEAAMKYEPGFKEQYLKETKRYREASAAFNKACDEITKSIVEDNGNIPIRSLYTSDEYNTQTFDKVVNTAIREMMIGYPYQNNSK